jgi:hypothetical protein
LVQGLNIWLCCGLLGGVVAAGFARIGFSLNVTQFGVVIAAFAAGLVLLAALAVVPLRRVYVATNVVVALLSGFLAVQLVSISVSRTDAVVLDSPLTGEWFVQNGGRSILFNGHAQNESNAVDFQRMGANGRTHTGGSGAPLADYVGFGIPVLAPADGRIVEVTDHYADNPPGTNSDHANHLVVDIGDGRYLSFAHLKQGSVTVRVGDVVQRGQRLAAVETTATRTSRTCTCRYRTPRQERTPTGPTPCCSATSISPGAVPGHGVTAASFAPATSSGHSGSENNNVEAGPAPRFTAGGEPAVGGGLCHLPGGLQWLLGQPARPGRRPLPGRRGDCTPAVPGCRFADAGAPRRAGLYHDDLGRVPRRPGA